MSVLDWIFSILVGILTIPVSVLLIETIASLLPIRRRIVAGSRPSCLILIPAHNEELGIAETLRGLKTEIASTDRILVIADNCTDRTAEIAREFSVEVLERYHATERGKGFAIEAGLQSVAANPPEYVVIFDADCRFESGSLATLIESGTRSQLPTQAIYLPGVRKDDSVRSRIARFALRFKNEARPTGLFQLGLPCLLTGSGMIFSWKVIRSVSWGTGNIVEDMRLGIDLAVEGFCPKFCPQALVTSDAPPSDQATMKQRTRWEHGHVMTIVSQVPRLFLQSVAQLRPRLAFVALELCVPPLSLLVMMLFGVTAGSWANWLILAGSELPLYMSLIACGTLILTIFLAWCKYGRGIVPIGSLLLIPFYLMWKIPIYLRLVGNREKKWVRTDRA